MISAGSDQQVVRPAVDPGRFPKALRESPAQCRPPRVRGVSVHVGSSEGGLRRSHHGSRWLKEGQCLPQRNHVVTRSPELRRSHVQRVERWQLEVENARRDLHETGFDAGLKTRRYTRV